LEEEMNEIEAEIRHDEREKCCKEIESLAQAHRLCADDCTGVNFEMEILHYHKARSLDHCAKWLRKNAL
jgi:hypothetical protein